MTADERAAMEDALDVLRREGRIPSRVFVPWPPEDPPWPNDAYDADDLRTANLLYCRLHGLFRTTTEDAP